MAKRKRKKKVQVSLTQAMAGTSILWILVAIMTGGWMAWVAAGGFSAATALTIARPGGGRAPARRPASGRRGGGRKPAAAPLTNHAQRVKRGPILGTERCSAACRSSRKPAYDRNGVLKCDCPCGGRSHGKFRPDSTAAVRGQRPTAAQRSTERRAHNRRMSDEEAARQAKWGDDGLKKAAARRARRAPKSQATS